MKRYFTIVLYIILLTPFVSYAQRNNNKTKQEETIIWRTGTYPSFTENKITPIQQKEKLDSLVNNSECIVEGRLTKYFLTFTDDKGNIWQIFQINICQNIKGDTSTKMIYFMFPCHHLYYDPNDINHDYIKETPYGHSPDYFAYDNGFFFLKKTQMSMNLIKPDSTISKYNFFAYYDTAFLAHKNSSIIYESTDTDIWGIGYNTSGLTHYYEGPYRMKFPRREDVYKYITEQYDLEIPNYSTTFEKKSLLDSLLSSPTINDINPEEEEESFKIWINGGRKYKKDLLQKSNIQNSVTYKQTTKHL